MTASPSVIIGDFDFIRSVSLPEKTNSPLIIDPDAVLPDSICSQHLQPVSWWGTQVLEIRRVIEHREFPLSNLLEAGEFPDHLSRKELLRLFVPKTSDHGMYLTIVLRVTYYVFAKFGLKIVPNDLTG